MALCFCLFPALLLTLTIHLPDSEALLPNEHSKYPNPASKKEHFPPSDAVQEKQTVKRNAEENMEKYVSKGSNIDFLLFKSKFIICWSYSLEGKANSDSTGRMGKRTFSNPWLPP